jgi:hypothetical protein
MKKHGLYFSFLTLSILGLCSCDLSSLISSSFSSTPADVSSSDSHIDSSSNLPEISSSSSSSSSSEEPAVYHYDWTYDFKSYKNGSYTNYIDYSVGTTYRLPISSPKNGLVPIYQIDTTSETKITLLYNLKEDEMYTDPGEVASYYQAFKKFPKNYVLYDSGEDSHCTSGYESDSKARSVAYNNYGTMGRIYTSYCRKTGYVKSFSSFPGGSYYEADIDNGPIDYWDSSTRGAGRLVCLINGVSSNSYGGNTVVYRTSDHYASFREFANFYNGWSGNFDGEKTKFSFGKNTPLTTLAF